MTNLPNDPADDQERGAAKNVGMQSAFRSLLLFIIVMMLPVIGLLVFLNVRKKNQEAAENQPDAVQAEQVEPLAPASVPVVGRGQETEGQETEGQDRSDAEE
ncbi:hypothetical protein Mal15_11200 [Stieleria maiorica]|uniref:Uncharacterized protein n=1 Tax=Stieleria maiorica TaxID=2795974 RepID=A0A5B9MC02_9BACT|nr:hypothetical protein [Stieleria maiorica]QEF97085.1 hypothetical protein Mal15_11200 [Stieleria maiorica]